MFDLNCAAKPPALRRRYFAESAPKSAPLPRKNYVDAAESISKASAVGKARLPSFKIASNTTSQSPTTTEPSMFTYLNFNIGGTASTSRGRSERHRRKPVFDYVPWSLLDR